jgi:hypothetical protein
MRQVEQKKSILVTLLQNLNVKAGLVNGSTGKIIGWEK